MEELKLSAVNFGFDSQWIADLLQKYGQDGLALAIEAARNGLSTQLITEVMQKFGPDLIQFLLNLQNNHKSFAPMGMAADAKGFLGLDSGVLLDTVQQQFGNGLLQKLLQQYGPQIAQILIQVLMANMKK